MDWQFVFARRCRRGPGILRCMKVRPFLVLTGLIGILTGRIGGVGLRAQDISFTNLPSVQDVKFRADPYVKVTGQLQEMGQQTATQQLLRLAKSAASIGRSTLDNEQRTAILCRMLFTNKPGSGFERPAFLGAPVFLGEGILRSDPFRLRKNFIHWRSEPLEIVGGIPFAIVTGYSYQGIWDPHAAESYVC